MPQAIVVAVHNTNRMRDLTTPVVEGFQVPMGGGGEPGGSDRFLAFVADELVPAIDRRYRTRPFRVLVGHSLGGLTVARAAALRPETFRGYVAMDPSMWWNDRADAEGVIEVAAGRYGAGTYDIDRGVDLDTELTFAVTDDSVAVTQWMTGPRGGRFGGAARIIRLDEDGTLYRGGAGSMGMNVSIARLEADGTLVGSTEVWGVKRPKDGSMPRTVFRLSRR